MGLSSSYIMEKSSMLLNRNLEAVPKPELPLIQIDIQNLPGLLIPNNPL